MYILGPETMLKEHMNQKMFETEGPLVITQFNLFIL